MMAYSGAGCSEMMCLAGDVFMDCPPFYGCQLNDDLSTYKGRTGA
jgi:hypothetical protein